CAVYLAAFKDVSEKSTGIITRCIIVGLIQLVKVTKLKVIFLIPKFLGTRICNFYAVVFL
ncbi:MAG: hypothetical protein KBA90_03375, partial [Chitinophagaceae bacterium]|nr:hypothetical protein [Chitinophagaceae bacterium]